MSGITSTWNSTKSGSFTTSGFWTNNHVPGSADTADIIQGGTVSIAGSTPIAITALNVNIGTLTVAGASGSTIDVSSTVDIGSSTGTINLGSTINANKGTLSAGSATIDGYLNIGVGSNSSATGLASTTSDLTLGIGGVITLGNASGASGKLNVGGTLYDTGGSLTLNNGSVSLSAASQSAGTITLNAGSLNVAGLLNQTGGTIAVSSGQFTAGTLVEGGAIGVSSGLLDVTGTLTETTHGTITIGGGALDTAALTQNDGAITVNGGTLNDTGTLTDSGTITLNGGTLNVGGLLSQNASGTISVGGGQFTAGALTEAGTIGVSGGLLGVTGTLTENTGGATTVSGGALNTAALTQNGGAITVSGGTLNDTGTLTDSGAITLTSGSLNVGGLLSQNASGTISVGGGQFTASALAESGSIGVTGGLLDVIGTLTDSGAITIGAGTLEAGTLTQAGGSITFAASGGTLEISDASGPATIALGALLGTTDTVFWNNTVTDHLGSLTLANFINGDTLDIATSGAVTNAAVAYSGTGTLTVTGTIGSSGFTDTVYVTTPGAVTSSDFAVSYNNSGYLQVTSDAACFLRGTRIATLRGEVAVEGLRIGDLVVIATGSALPIKWIGTRGFVTKLVNEHHRAALLPIRIAAGALGAASPVRDLYVSPEHMMCLDGVLIPAGKLLNGTTISRAENIDVVEYFHIELSRHAVLYAEGAPAESFLDTGNRNMFANVLSYLELGHDLDAPPQPACLPIVTDGEALAAVRARLAGRADKTGLTTTEDDDLHLLVDGAAVRPEQRQGDTARFSVAAGARQVRIVSRSVAPADLDPTSGDRRRLGIAFSGMSLHDGSFALDLAPSYAGFATGFHASEGGHRWTEGDALLPDDLTATMPDGFVMDLKLVRTGMRYPAPAQTEAIRFASRHTERLSA